VESVARSAQRLADLAAIEVVIGLGALGVLVVRMICYTNQDATNSACSTAERRSVGYLREELPLPSRPPFTAHLGNLSFEVTEGDVQDFLSGCDVTSVRIVEDKLDHRPKGFGYVEFGTVEGLKKALGLSETQFQGRNIRISVAEPRKFITRPTCIEPPDAHIFCSKGP